MGTVTVCGIICDLEGVYNYYERPVDFEYTYNLTGDTIKPTSAVSVSIVNTSYTITSATSIEIKLELLVSAAIYGHREITLITDIVLDDKCGVKGTENSGIVVYFPEIGESVWEIAKRYNSQVSEIKELNLLTENEITVPKGLMIPVK